MRHHTLETNFIEYKSPEQKSGGIINEKFYVVGGSNRNL